MQTHARVVVIGGGVVGCSILFHLARAGWKDVVLLERSELTSGSSWHAAGMFHTISADPNLSSLQSYTIGLYDELEEISGQDIGLHVTGQIYLASTPDRVDYLKQERSKAHYLGLPQEFISLEEAVEKNPLIDPSKYLAALYDPVDGHIDPSGVVHAFAKAARKYGATIHRNTPVVETNPRADGGWDVVTPAGTVHAEYVINAAGLWAREVGQMAGVVLPVQPMEHHYLITEEIPEIAAHPQEICGGVDYEANIYFRQEHQGMLLGTYEGQATPWQVKRTPSDFGHELLPDDLDRVADRLELAFDAMPALGRAGIKSVINGPFTFGPDGSPLIGPVPGLRNYWVAVGVMAGFCQGGGVGKVIAEWMIEGEPSMDVWAMDVARFGEFATFEYGTAKASENYERRFQMTFPNEELPAMRCQKTTAIYDRLVGAGAVMGASFGLEHALWFADGPENAVEQPTYRRSNAFPSVGEEVRAVREAVGAIEIANFSKHEFWGPGSKQFLSYVLAGRIPAPGRMALTPMLTNSGKLIGDLTIACLEEQRYLLLGSGAAQEMHRRWFESLLPEQGVRYRNRSDEYHGMAISGPRAREVLQKLCRENVGAEHLRFLDVRDTSVAGVPAILARISFSGELGYEIYCAPQYQARLYDAILRAGNEEGIRLYGNRALMSLRLEKNWGVWTLDYRPDFTAAEAGLDGFVDFSRRDFMGRDAAAAERESGPKRRLVSFLVDANDADCGGDEALFHDGQCIGSVTSGGYAHYSGQSVALAYVPVELSAARQGYEIEILGERRSAVLQSVPLYDPGGERIRS